MDIVVGVVENLIEIVTRHYKFFVFAIVVVIVADLLKTPSVKGRIGEFSTRLSTRLFGLGRSDPNGDSYHMLADITLPAGHGTTQIDLIIVSEYGVFVIETKNMKGFIYCAEHQRTWTQVIYRKKYKFQNPLRQNYKHTQVLKKLLGLADRQIFSLVVFTGDCKFKTPMPDNVFKGGSYLNYIRSQCIPVLTPLQVEEITHKIQTTALTNSRETARSHREYVKSLQKEKSAQPSFSDRLGQGIPCPKCGCAMVKRVAKRGKYRGQQFWGCSRFPRCRGMVR